MGHGLRGAHVLIAEYCRVDHRRRLLLLLEDRRQDAQGLKTRLANYHVKSSNTQLQIPYTILGGTYIALYSWRLFYYVEVLYLRDGVLIGKAKW